MAKVDGEAMKWRSRCSPPSHQTLRNNHREPIVVTTDRASIRDAVSRTRQRLLVASRDARVSGSLASQNARVA
jgi:hypothetical protein